MTRRIVDMLPLDRRAAFALRGVRGLSPNARRIADALVRAARTPEPITINQRHALYAICWRFRRQLPTKLLVSITMALADAKAAAEVARMEQPHPDRIRAARPSPIAARPNPLNDLFSKDQRPLDTLRDH